MGWFLGILLFMASYSNAMPAGKDCGSILLNPFDLLESPTEGWNHFLSLFDRELREAFTGGTNNPDKILADFKNLSPFEVNCDGDYSSFYGGYEIISSTYRFGDPGRLEIFRLEGTTVRFAGVLVKLEKKIVRYNRGSSVIHPYATEIHKEYSVVLSDLMVFPIPGEPSLLVESDFASRLATNPYKTKSGIQLHPKLVDRIVARHMETHPESQVKRRKGFETKVTFRSSSGRRLEMLLYVRQRLHPTNPWSATISSVQVIESPIDPAPLAKLEEAFESSTQNDLQKFWQLFRPRYSEVVTSPQTRNLDPSTVHRVWNSPDDFFVFELKGPETPSQAMYLYARQGRVLILPLSELNQILTPVSRNSTESQILLFESRSPILVLHANKRFTYSQDVRFIAPSLIDRQIAQGIAAPEATKPSPTMGEVPTSFRRGLFANVSAIFSRRAQPELSKGNEIAAENPLEAFDKRRADWLMSRRGLVLSRIWVEAVRSYLIADRWKMAQELRVTATRVLTVIRSEISELQQQTALARELDQTVQAKGRASEPDQLVLEPFRNGGVAAEVAKLRDAESLLLFVMSQLANEGDDSLLDRLTAIEGDRE